MASLEYSSLRGSHDGSAGIQLQEVFASLQTINLAGDICNKEDVQFGQGSSCEVFRAWSNRHCKQVALKRIRYSGLRENLTLARNLERELRLWYRLKHPNILPLLGFFLEEPSAIPNLVSEWMKNGTLTIYMWSRPADVTEICEMVLGIACGLNYIHTGTDSIQIIHSDLKGSNILVSDDGRPLIADFGLSISPNSLSLAGTTNHGRNGSSRWMARELHSYLINSKHTVETDMWAFGMVICELLNRELPYAEVNDQDVVGTILSGRLPRSPKFDEIENGDIVRELWSICLGCWNEIPQLRLLATTIIQDATKLLHHSRNSTEMVYRKEAHVAGAMPFQPGATTMLADSGSTVTIRGEPEGSLPKVAYLPIVGSAGSSVPGLSRAGSLVGKIIGLSSNLQWNRNVANQLYEDIKALFETLEQASTDGWGRDSHDVRRIMENFLKLLRDVKGTLTDWSKFFPRKALLYSFTISGKVEPLGERMGELAREFQLHGLAKLPTFVDYNESRMKDRRLILHELARPQDYEDLKVLASNARFTEEARYVWHTIDQVTEEINKATSNEACLQGLRRFLISIAPGNTGINKLPSSLQIPYESIQFDPGQRVAGSDTGMYDIYRGMYISQVVAIKKSRLFTSENGSVDNVLREAKNWSSACASDPNEDYILQLIGVTFDERVESIFMVSRWMGNRDLLTFIRQHGERVNRKRVVKRIAKGLEILHTHNPPIAHGNLRASNIVVNDKGDPLLGGFGLSEVLESINEMPELYQIQQGDSFRWLAPELLKENAFNSAQSDVYSFAMTVLELMTDERPFMNIDNSYLVPREVVKGNRPERPIHPSVTSRGLDDDLWVLISQCWAQEPMDRPHISEVIEELDIIWR